MTTFLHHRRQRRSVIATGIIFVSAIVAVAVGFNPSAQAEALDCVKLRTQSQGTAAGYNHIVFVTNGCKQPVRCHVTTNANKKGVHLRVGVGKTERTNTFLGSPAPQFQARADCAKVESS